MSNPFPISPKLSSANDISDKFQELNLTPERLDVGKAKKKATDEELDYYYEIYRTQTVDSINKVAEEKANEEKKASDERLAYYEEVYGVKTAQTIEKFTEERSAREKQAADERLDYYNEVYGKTVSDSSSRINDREISAEKSVDVEKVNKTKPTVNKILDHDDGTFGIVDSISSIENRLRKLEAGISMLTELLPRNEASSRIRDDKILESIDALTTRIEGIAVQHQIERDYDLRYRKMRELISCIPKFDGSLDNAKIFFLKVEDCFEKLTWLSEKEKFSKLYPLLHTSDQEWSKYYTTSCERVRYSFSFEEYIYRLKLRYLIKEDNNSDDVEKLTELRCMKFTSKKRSDLRFHIQKHMRLSEECGITDNGHRIDSFLLSLPPPLREELRIARTYLSYYEAMFECWNLVNSNDDLSSRENRNYDSNNFPSGN